MAEATTSEQPRMTPISMKDLHSSPLSFSFSTAEDTD